MAEEARVVGRSREQNSMFNGIFPDAFSRCLVPLRCLRYLLPMSSIQLYDTATRDRIAIIVYYRDSTLQMIENKRLHMLFI